MTATADPNTGTHHHFDGDIPSPDPGAQPDDLELARGWAGWAAEKLQYWIDTESEGGMTPSTFIDLGLKLASTHAQIAAVEENRKHLRMVADWRERDLEGQQLDRDLVRVLTPDRVAEVIAAAQQPVESEALFPSEEFEAAEATAEQAAGATG